MNPMNCEDTIERLPWLLNGSLEAGERAALLVHLRGCERCREALGETRAAFDVFSQHLSPEELTALAADESPAGVDADLLWRHVETCALCSSDLELARMSRQLVADDKVALMPAGRRRAGRPSWLTAALAAGLTAVVLGGGWMTTSRKVDRLSVELAERRGQQGVESNLESYTLEAATVERGTGEPQGQDLLPAGVPLSLDIVPKPGDKDPPKTLHVEIFDGDGLFAKPKPLKLGTSRTYTLVVWSDTLPPGSYTLRGHRSEGDGVPYLEYPFRIVSP